MTDTKRPRGVSRVFGRLMMVNAIVWAATMLACAVVARASDQFSYLLLVLIAGAALSNAVVSQAADRANASERR